MSGNSQERLAGEFSAGGINLEKNAAKSFYVVLIQVSKKGR